MDNALSFFYTKQEDKVSKILILDAVECCAVEQNVYVSGSGESGGS